MNIRSIVDNLKKPFEKGQKLEKFYPAFDAFETFLFVTTYSNITMLPSSNAFPFCIYFLFV